MTSRSSIRPQTLAAFLAFAALLAVAGTGCSRNSCDAACAQYYGEGDTECKQQSLQPTNNDSPEQAMEKCIEACEDALYVTRDSGTTGDDGRGNNQLGNENDAINFIECVVEKDYSAEVRDTTCQNLRDDCPWFIW